MVAASPVSPHSLICMRDVTEQTTMSNLCHQHHHDVLRVATSAPSAAVTPFADRSTDIQFHRWAEADLAPRQHSTAALKGGECTVERPEPRWWTSKRFQFIMMSHRLLKIRKSRREKRCHEARTSHSPCRRRRAIPPALSDSPEHIFPGWFDLSAAFCWKGCLSLSQKPTRQPAMLHFSNLPQMSAAPARLTRSLGFSLASVRLCFFCNSCELSEQFLHETQQFLTCALHVRLPSSRCRTPRLLKPDHFTYECGSVHLQLNSKDMNRTTLLQSLRICRSTIATRGSQSFAPTCGSNTQHETFARN